MPPPKAFISYSWDDDEHKVWVSKLATDLRRDGVETRLDEWHAALGDQVTHFMETEIRKSDFVLIVCTPNYRVKSDKRTGGVGYEGDIITADVATRGNHRKYIPVLARGSWSEAAPSWLKGKKYVDLRTEAAYSTNYRVLACTLLGNAAIAPPIGNPSNAAIDAGAITGRPHSSDQAATTRSDVFSDSQPAKHDINPIRILGVDTDNVTEPTLNGSPGSALYLVPLLLNRRPSPQWSQIFEKTWNRPPGGCSSMHRPGIATVTGSRIVLDGTTLEEIEKYHRGTLNLCVNVANQTEAEFLRDRQRAEERQQQQADDHRREVEERSKRICFD